jgi:hypothetical protein
MCNIIQSRNNLVYRIREFFFYHNNIQDDSWEYVSSPISHPYYNFIKYVIKEYKINAPDPLEYSIQLMKQRYCEYNTIIEELNRREVLSIEKCFYENTDRMINVNEEYEWDDDFSLYDRAYTVNMDVVWIPLYPNENLL